MKPARLRCLATLCGLGLFAVGCTTTTPKPETIRAAGPGVPVTAPAQPEPSAPRIFPIDLDTVLRLTGEHNPQIQTARAKLHSSEIEREQAERDWLPTVNMGMAYLRHEGGIQDQDGTFLRSSYGAMMPGMHMHGIMNLREYAFKVLNAERQIHQNDGELARITSENLLEAANTYFDLLTARTAEGILRQLGDHEKKLLDRAEKLFKEQPSA